MNSTNCKYPWDYVLAGVPDGFPINPVTGQVAAARLQPGASPLPLHLAAGPAFALAPAPHSWLRAHQP